MFEQTFVDLPCPRCGYPSEVQLLDMRLESRVFCPCCKVAIQLIDDRASMRVAPQQAEDALRRLGFHR